MTATETLHAADRSAMDGLAEAMENAIDYVGGASASFGSSVKSAAGKSADVMVAGVYKGAYGVSYGVVFGAVFLKELLPTGNVVRRGFEDGAHAAFDAIETRKSAPTAEEAGDEADEPAPKVRAARRKAETVYPEV